MPIQKERQADNHDAVHALRGTCRSIVIVCGQETERTTCVRDFTSRRRSMFFGKWHTGPQSRSSCRHRLPSLLQPSFLRRSPFRDTSVCRRRKERAWLSPRVGIGPVRLLHNRSRLAIVAADRRVRTRIGMFLLVVVRQDRFRHGHCVLAHRRSLCRATHPQRVPLAVLRTQPTVAIAVAGERMER